MAQPVKKKIRKSNKPCVFCVKKTEPDFKDIESLRVGLSNKDRIVSRLLTGLCQKHQKRLSMAVKRARHLALLPFDGRL
ncbi:30S ribosomal protein S18 [Candidatus Collierbacteria bacterium RIFCSPLOWO2_01_FULL_50_23]|uniref:Small ribosomal subunit protein bS18 n=2 Tax=Candidatus Collieribacteriota TaxID=1752725 RepID=A0A1F5ERH2_9BACT|nr:MAG: 30S ribosomal protein S18 [Candidatus Collierbacteria bacterium RIFCSPHIGHO2_02_FULL_49_10]OGD72244.1 MAG: 30S ribosomal protein S18 [Candidatus Collierbacteria bacterium RIFCSPHIGHO2_01_FULL_50_25]OGD73833.1 MAG: 30S ribosomal protein S18 [Candidatus Collierbacteria bacterium RIFCSPLOWO2_01_FULL_50_23]